MRPNARQGFATKSMAVVTTLGSSFPLQGLGVLSQSIAQTGHVRTTYLKYTWAQCGRRLRGPPLFAGGNNVLSRGTF